MFEVILITLLARDELPPLSRDTLLRARSDQERLLLQEGVYPKYFDFLLRKPESSRPPERVQLAIDVFDDRPQKDDEFPEFTGMWTNSGARREFGYDAIFWIKQQEKHFREPWNGAVMTLRANQGSIFPLMDCELYRTSFGPDDLVRLTNVTATFPRELQPRKSSLIIPGNCRDSEYFQHQLQTAKWSDSGRIRIYLRVLNIEFMAEQPSAAIITWRRNEEGVRTGVRATNGAERQEYESQFLMPEKGTTTLRTGDEFSTGYRLFKVQNVVPAGDLPDGGHCEGWVELEVIEHPATDESAAVKDE